MLTWHKYAVLFSSVVWNQAAEGPPCSAGFGSGCRERGCTAGPTCAEQAEQQKVQGGTNWRFGWWSHWEHHWVATSTRWVLPVCCYPLTQLIPCIELLMPLKCLHSTSEFITFPGNCIFPSLQRGCICFEVAGAVEFGNRFWTEAIKWLGKKMTLMYLPSVFMIISIKH